MLWSLIIGAISGWLAGKLFKGRSFGLVWNIVVGIAGAYIGAFIFRLLGFYSYGVIGSIITSTVGAVVLLWILGRFTKIRL